MILTYNSSEDLAGCLVGLRMQRGVDLRLIVVDNASKPDQLAQLEAIFHEILPEGRIFTASAAAACDTSAVFLRNDVNSGYSAGNNIGARFASDIGCEAVLIINPDVRINEPDFLAGLVDLITAHTDAAVACSAITNLSGAHENPMIEPNFVEEVLLPAKMLFGRFLPSRRVGEILPSTPLLVEKVCGACFLIRTDFLHQIGFLDESVFLYCEESILSAQVRAAGLKMMMAPRLHALHAHRTNTKGGQLVRFQNWAKSRSRFHAVYGSYGALGQALLAGSRSLTLGLVWMRELTKRALTVVSPLRGRK